MLNENDRQRAHHVAKKWMIASAKGNILDRSLQLLGILRHGNAGRLKEARLLLRVSCCTILLQLTWRY